MAASRHRSPLRPGLAWLLWLALLLPMAQSAAVWHGFSHVRAQASEDRHDEQAPQAEHCDLCLSAAALSGGALLVEHGAPLLPTGRHALPGITVASAWGGLPLLGYRSRAPPISTP